MAWSTPDTDSLHVTIGIQRGGKSTRNPPLLAVSKVFFDRLLVGAGPQHGFSSQTWARLIQQTALGTLNQPPPYEALAAHPRLHRIPNALAGGALQRAAFAEDLLWEDLLGLLVGCDFKVYH